MKKTIVFSVIILLFAIHINAQKIINQNGKYGVSSDDGKILTELKYDSAYIPDQEKKEEGGAKFVFTQKNNKFGLIIFPSDTLPIVIEPKLDTIFFQNYYYIVVKQNNKYGFIAYSSRYKAPDAMRHFSDFRVWIKNVFISEIEYDKISDRQLFIDNKCGYLFQGKLEFGSGKTLISYRVVPAIYDTLEFLKNNQIVYNTYNKFENLVEGDSNLRETFYYVFKVKKDGFVNYLSVNGKVADKPMNTIFPFNTYKDEEICNLQFGFFVINQIDKPLQLFNVIDSAYVQLKDLQDKEIVLDRYYNFRNGRLTIDCVFNPFSNKTDSILKFIGEKNNSKGEIVIFANIRNGQCLVFQNDERDDRYDLLRIYNKYDKFKGVIKKTTKNKIDGETQMDFSLLSFPDRKLLFSVTYNPRKEKIGIGYPKEPNFECCCKYFQIVKREENEKISVLGYINIETLAFCKKKPKGCPNDDYKYDYKK